MQRRGRRPNSNWGKRVLQPMAVTTSEFELKIKALNLTTIEEQILSRDLKKWADKNKNSCFVPEKLLKCWGFTVNDDFL